MTTVSFNLFQRAGKFKLVSNYQQSNEAYNNIHVPEKTEKEGGWKKVKNCFES